MLINRLIETSKADAELPPEIRAALVESLFAPIASLIVGAIACSIIGAAVALRVGNEWILANSIAIFAVGMLRVVSAVLYRRYKKAADRPTITKRWEHVYESGAWAFSSLLGLLCWLTLMQTSDGALQLAVTTTAAGYAAAISGRNAGRPFIALGQLTLTHAADGDCAAHLSRLAAQGAGLRGAAVHLRHDRHHAQHPRRHRPGA